MEVVSPGSRAPRILTLGCVLASLLAAVTGSALASASTAPSTTPRGASSSQFPIPASALPASERVHGTTPTVVAPQTPPAGAAAKTPTVAFAAKTPTAASPTRTARAAAPKKLSTGAIVAAALAALLILVCLAWGAARWWAYEPRWTISLRHSLAEAGWHLSASWEEFADWVRLGR
jgi:hypothetical protein